MSSGTLNKVMLIGNLGDEVKMHYFENGDCIGRFPIATSETYTSKKTGERTTNTEWHNIVVRNKAAEICEKYLGKGDKVYVEGRLRTRQWQGEDGITRYSTEVQAQDFTFLTPKSESTASPQPDGHSQNSEAERQSQGKNSDSETSSTADAEKNKRSQDQKTDSETSGTARAQKGERSGSQKKGGENYDKPKDPAPLSQSEEDDLPF